MTDTTKRMSSTTTLDSLRNVRNAIASLTLKRANNGFLTHEQNEELARLQARRVRLEQEYAKSLKYQGKPS